MICEITNKNRLQSLPAYFFYGWMTKLFTNFLKYKQNTKASMSIKFESSTDILGITFIDFNGWVL